MKKMGRAEAIASLIIILLFMAAVLIPTDGKTEELEPSLWEATKSYSSLVWKKTKESSENTWLKTKDTTATAWHQTAVFFGKKENAIWSAVTTTGAGTALISMNAISSTSIGAITLSCSPLWVPAAAGLGASAAIIGGTVLLITNTERYGDG